MLKRLLWLIPLFTVLISIDGQAPLPTTTYQLHAQKEHHSANLPSTLLYLAPDKALLVLIPQQDGKWLFKRLTAWEMTTPKEETLSFVANAPQEGSSGFEDLKVDAEGHYAVIRIRSYSGSINSQGRTRSAVIVVVDLRAFRIVSRQDTTDLLLASGDWVFVGDGRLVASALVERLTTPERPKNGWSYDTISDNYKAAALTLPKLTPSMECQYTLFLDHRKGSNRSDRYLSKADEGCAALVALAQVPSAENLPDGPPKLVPYAALAGPTCEFAGESPTATYALYGCRTGHDYLDGMIATTNTRNLTVLQIPGGQRVLEVSLPHNMTPYPAVLASAGDHSWLLLLKDGIKLESYRLP